MGKKFTSILLFLLLCAGATMAQCPSCTPVFSTCPPAGGLCNKLDTAYAHHPFNKVINFYMPKVITDPVLLAQCDGCSQIDLLSITVTGASGLPAGVSYLISNNSYFDVQAGDSMGCATFCGTPLLAGVYIVTVYLEADVTAIGTPIGNVTQNNNPQQYIDTLWVLPDTVAGVSSFTYGNNGFSACDSITVSLNAVVTAPQPNPVRYFWNIGGITTQARFPGSFTYKNTSSVPDTIPITLTTVIYNYIVQNVHISKITGGFCGGIPHQQLACSCITGLDSPNPFVEFPLLGFNNNANYVSASCNNINWNGINVPIPEGIDTVNMQLWDADEGDLFHIYTNELISTYPLMVQLSQMQYQFADNNAYGYVQFDTVAGTTITETLNVIVNPTPRNPNVLASRDTFCTGDSVTVAIDSASLYPDCTYQWYRDSVFLTANSDSGFYTSQPGNYRVIITNASTGCTVTSHPQKIVAETTPPSSPSLTLSTNPANQIFINPLPSGTGANWYYNGYLVTGQNGGVLNYLGNGVYGADLYNLAYPLCATTLTPLTVSALSIEEVGDNAVTGVIISPNPNQGKFHLQFSSPQQQTVHISVENVIGEMVYTQQLVNFNGTFNQDIDLNNLSKGVYLLWIETPSGKYNRKIIVQ